MIRIDPRNPLDCCFAYFFFGALLIVGVLLILFFRPDEAAFRIKERTYREGKEAVGTVTYLEHNDGRRAEYHTVSYRFHAEGATFEWSDDPGHEIYHRLGYGSEVPIIYLPEDPQKTSQIGPRERIKPERERPVIGLILTGFAALVLMIVFVLQRLSTRTR